LTCSQERYYTKEKVIDFSHLGGVYLVNNLKFTVNPQI